jgi:hypothetical protein
VYGFPIAVVLAATVGLLPGGLLIFTRRRVSKTIICPMAMDERQVTFVGHALDPDQWEDVTSCGRADEAPVTGRHIACAKSCLLDPTNAPAIDLPTVPAAR